MNIGTAKVGGDAPVYVIAEIGQNHNGDIDLALRMVKAAHDAGADAVKFQKRTPELSIPEEQQRVERDTPWGRMSYLDYRRKLEFGNAEYSQIALYCRQRGITWFASAWDIPSVEFLKAWDVPAIKIPSACLTDSALLKAACNVGKPVILSTGMSTADEIYRQVDLVRGYVPGTVVMHCKSAYPTAPSALNLRAITKLTWRYAPDRHVVIGYSGHEVGLWTTLMAVVLGAQVVERHFTLDRSMWGTDQAASVEPNGFRKLVLQIRRWQEAAGDGQLGMHPSEEGPRKKLRRI